MKESDLKVGGKYNWVYQSERLQYMGKSGLWHQFALTEKPEIVWCEVLNQDLDGIEETNPC